MAPRKAAARTPGNAAGRTSRKSARSKASAAVHTTPRETHPWSVYVVDHPMRAESAWFRAAKRTARKILSQLGPDGFPYGPGPWEMHHGGSLWVRGADGWRLYLARAGIEWSMQFCADPAKVDLLRRDALALAQAFPETLPAPAELGYEEAEEILTAPITDAKTVERFTDSLFNSCVPLSRPDHQGVLPSAAGEHHYPLPVKAGDFIRYDDFQLWVDLPDGTHGAVTPLKPRGSGNAEVRLVYARHGTAEGDAVVRAQREHKAVVLPPGHSLARQAYARQA
ncbi:MAG TPA: DUF6424 family protein [Amycolatopsis sp.]|nr:DUF6424 family protein [Amycolatopsis sp.]